MNTPTSTNEVSGTVIGNVVQAGSIGDIHMHSVQPAVLDEAGIRLRSCLRQVTAIVEGTAGFLIAPGTVLTPDRGREVGTMVTVTRSPGVVISARVHLTESGWSLLRFPPDGHLHGCVGTQLVLGDRLEACAPTPPGVELLIFCHEVDAHGPGGHPLRGRVPPGAEGTPILNQRTGAICGLLGTGGRLIPIAEVLDNFADVLPPRTNRSWLSMLDDSRLAAGGHRYPSSGLRGYLASLERAGHRHPYTHLIRDAPSLEAVYVTQRTARHMPETRQARSGHGEATPRTSPRTMPADELLHHHPDGVQVEGAPGAGKSSFVRRLAAEQARRWRTDGTGDFVPILVSATAFSEGRGLPDALASGVANEISVGLDHAELVRLFRTAPIPGVPWLVLVDGMDEVFPPDRQKAMEAIADHRGVTHRFLVTSRPLGIDLSKALGSSNGRRYATYTIEPFSTDNLASLATAWFRALGRPNPTEMAGELIRRLTEPQLHELGRIPLFATMLCILMDHDPAARLPRSQAELFRRFIDWATGKLAESGHRRKVMVGLGTVHCADQFVAELCGRIVPLMREIAYRRQGLSEPEQAGAPILDLAMQQTAVGWPASIPDADCEGILAEVLRSCGLLIERRDGFEFLHQTIEEYLAAEHVAAMHPDGPSWLHRASTQWLAPRDALPWPHLEVRMFLTARWMQSGDRAAPALHKLLRRGGPANLEFLADLERRGISLPDDVRSGLVRHLVHEVRTARSPAVFGRAIRQLWTLEKEQAATQIRVFAGQHSESVSWRWRYAVTEVSMLDFAGADELLTSMAADQSGTPARRLTAAAMITAAGGQRHRVLVRLAHDMTMGEQRIDAAETAGALGLLVRMAYEQWSGRGAACVALKRHLNQHGPRTWLEIATHLRGVDDEWAAQLAYDVASIRDDAASIEIRVEAVVLLADLRPATAARIRLWLIEDLTLPVHIRHRLITSINKPDLELISLARIGMSRGAPLPLRVAAGLVIAPHHHEAGIRILGDILDSEVLPDDDFFAVVTALCDLDPIAAAARVATHTSPHPNRRAASRLRAAALVAAALTPAYACKLYVTLSMSMDPELAIGASRALTKLLPDHGQRLSSWVMNRRDLRFRSRLSAAAQSIEP